MALDQRMGTLRRWQATRSVVLAGAVFLLGTSQCGRSGSSDDDAAEAGRGGGAGVAAGTGGTGGQATGGAGGGGTGGAGGRATGGAGANGGSAGAVASGGTAGGLASAGAGAIGAAGTGGFHNPCDPWPMTSLCLTIEEIEMRAAGASSGGASGAGGDVGAGGEPAVPDEPSDCPALPAGPSVFPCVDSVSGAASTVVNGKCCWQCRMVCG